MLGRMADLHQQEETEVTLLQEREDEESEEEAQKLVGLVGCAFEPVIAPADLDNDSGELESCSESEPEHDSDIHGDPEYTLDSTDWCIYICQNCTMMSTVKESTCCHEEIHVIMERSVASLQTQGFIGYVWILNN